MRRLLLLLALSASALFAPIALAQEESGGPTTSFQAADGGAHTEQIPGGPLVIAAYGAAFVLLLIYLLSLGFRQARTAREIERLRAEIDAHAPNGEKRSEKT
jgi:CcmD family protein